MTRLANGERTNTKLFSRASQQSSGTFQFQQFLLHGFRKVHKNKVILMIEVVLAALIDNAHKIVFGGS